MGELWHEFESPPSPGALPVHVRDSDGRSWLRLPDEQELPFDDPWGLAEVVRYQLVERAVAGAKGVVPLHAAALTRGPAGALFAGASGAGKTTLAVALARSGWSLAGDDIAPIDVETGLVHPFPKPLSIREPAVLGVVPAREAWPDPGPGPLLIPADALGPRAAPFLPTLLAFIAHAPDEAPLLEPVPPGRAALDCIEYVREGGAVAVSALAALCRRAAVWKIRYRSSAEALELVDKAVEGQK